MIRSEAVLGLPGYQITGIEEVSGKIIISARHTGTQACPHCHSERLRLKDRRYREPRHESWGLRHCILELETKIPVPRLRAKLLATVSGDTAGEAGD